MMPVIAWNALHASHDPAAGDRRVPRPARVDGIAADEARCRELLDRSTAVATALSPYIGYAPTAEIAKESVRTGRSVRELVLERGLLPAGRLDAILSPEAMTRAGAAGRRRMSAMSRDAGPRSVAVARGTDIGAGPASGAASGRLRSCRCSSRPRPRRSDRARPPVPAGGPRPARGARSRRVAEARRDHGRARDRRRRGRRRPRRRRRLVHGPARAPRRAERRRLRGGHPGADARGHRAARRARGTEERARRSWARAGDPRLPPGSVDVGAHRRRLPRVHESRWRCCATSARRSSRAAGSASSTSRSRGGGPGPPSDERKDENERHRGSGSGGLVLVRKETFLPFQYFLVLGRPAPPRTAQRRSRPVRRQRPGSTRGGEADLGEVGEHERIQRRRRAPRRGGRSRA